MALYKVDSDTADLTKVAGGTLYADAPVGTISPFGGSAIPSGYLLCNGAEVLKTTYAELYAVIGDAFGTASDNTKFKLPDLRGEFLRGAGTNSHTNQGDGGTVGEHQDGTLNKYIEGVSGDQIRVPVTNTSNFDKLIASTERVVYSNGAVAQTSNGKYGTTRPTNTSVNYIIKANHTPVPADFMDAVDEAVSTTLQEYPKRYVVDGYILNGDVIRGYGRATVMLYANGQAVIDYACRVTTANMGDAFGFGISPKILHQSNSNIPLITPSAGGTIMYYRTGSDSGVLYPQQDMVHFCGTHNTVQYGADMYWQFARLYAVGTAPGGWPTRQFPLDSYIQGTCYGTFTY